MSKLISFRISEAKYEEILLECNEKNISVTEWIEMQFAIAKKYKQQKNKVAVNRNLTIKQRLRLYWDYIVIFSFGIFIFILFYLIKK